MGDLFETGASPTPKQAAPPVAKPPKARAAKSAKPVKAAEKKAAKTGTAVAVHKPKLPRAAPAPKNATQMLSFIGSAAMDPRVDPGKMRELLAIRKDLKTEEAADAFNAAYMLLHVELAAIKITKGGVIEIYAKNDPDHLKPPIQRTKFSRYEDLQRIIRPSLHKHGFALMHKNGTSADGKPMVTTVLRHKGGHSESSEFVGEIDASGSKNNVQGRGSTISYGKRYNSVSLLDLVAEDDNDATQGRGVPAEPISQEQLIELQDKCVKHGVDQSKFKTFLKVQSLMELPLAKFDFAMKEIDRLKPLPQGGSK